MAMSHVSTNQFDYNPDTKQFTVDVSCLQNFDLGQVYPDAADLGFTMVSQRTGKEVMFVLNNTQFNDGDILSWEFKAISKDPIIKNLTTVIFND